MLSGNVAHNNPTTAGLFGLFGRSGTQPGAIPPQDQEAASPGAVPTDTVEISERSRQLLAAEAQNATAPTGETPEAPQATAATSATEADPTAAAEEESGNPQELSQEEQEQVKELKDRDREVRTHEQAHMAAAGGYSQGGPSYEYQRGPDGKRYAVGGHVSIDTSPVANDPEATIRKAQVIRNAANAPAEPSAQDRSVAAQAARMESEARQQLSEQRRQEASGQSGNASGTASDTGTDSATAAAAGSTSAPATAGATAPSGIDSTTTTANANQTSTATNQTTSQTAPGRFGRSSENVGQLLQLLA